MALCINDSGTYRNITTLCINNSGTYRDIKTGCINQSGTYRLFGFLAVGKSYEGGFLICCASPIRWVVSPYSAEVSRDFGCIADASTTSQQVSGCTGWFIPLLGDLSNPGYCCRDFWGPSPCYSSTKYWSSQIRNQFSAFHLDFTSGVGGTISPNRGRVYCVRAFRCVTY